MQIMYFNDTHIPCKVYTTTLNDYVGVCEAHSYIIVSILLPEHNKGIYFKTWDGIILISTYDLNGMPDT